MFDAVVAILEPTLRSVAPFTLSRLLLRARIYDRESMTTEEFERSLPFIERGLGEVVTPNELASITRQIRRLLDERGQEAGSARGGRVS